MKGSPMNRLVTLTPAVFRSISVQAAGHAVEGGGLVVGRRVRGGGIHVYHDIALTHLEANDSYVRYDKDDVAHARKVAWDTYAPLEPVGAWHSHPYGSYCVETLVAQISDDWDDPESDVSEMLLGNIEIIAVTFPFPGSRPADWRPPVAGEHEIQQRVGDRMIRLEAWCLEGEKDVRACRIRVRSLRG